MNVTGAVQQATASWEFMFLLVSVGVASISLVLQYLSHRHSILDTDYERQQKIAQDIGTEMVSFPNFPIANQTIGIRLLRPYVNERSGTVYRVWKYLYPFADLKGQTKVLLSIEPPDAVPIGLYAITGWSEESGVVAGLLLNKPSARPIIGLKINSVDIIQVRTTLGDLAYPGLQVSDDNDDIVDAVAHFPGVLGDLDA